MPAAGAGTPAFSPVVDLPTPLQAGATTNITVRLRGRDGDANADAPSMVQVELELELVGAARGWVRIPRARHLVAPADLQHRSFALQVAPAAPCGIVPGRLIVTVTAADGAAGSGEVRHLLPPIACDQLPPTAPPSMHAPAGSCADFDDDRPLAAAVVEPPGCNEPVRSRTPRPQETAPTDDVTDEPDGQDPDGDEPDQDQPEQDEPDQDQPEQDVAEDDEPSDGAPDAPDDGEEPDPSPEDPPPAPDQPSPDGPSGGADDDGDAPTDGGDGAGAPAEDQTSTTSGADDDETDQVDTRD